MYVYVCYKFFKDANLPNARRYNTTILQNFKGEFDIYSFYSSNLTLCIVAKELSNLKHNSIRASSIYSYLA